MTRRTLPSNVVKGRFRKPGRRRYVEQDGQLIDAAERFLPPSQSADEWYREGCRLDDAGKDKEAIAAYRRCLEQDPRHASALANLGTMHHQAGDLTGARRLFEQACIANPELWEAHYNLGHCAAMMDEWEIALTSLARAMELSHGNTDVLFNYADALYHTGNVEASKPYWRAYIKADPHSKWAKIALGRLGLRIVG